MAKGTVNRVIILGRLGQDPEARSTANGTQVVNLNVATNELGRADEQGNRPDLTEWHRIVLFGRMAENAAQYLKKGSQVYIEGRVQTRKWQDQSGQDRYSTDIIANDMQFIGGGGGGQGGGQQGSGGNYNQAPQGGGFTQQPAAPASNYNQPQQGGYNQSQQGGYNQPAQGGQAPAPAQSSRQAPPPAPSQPAPPAPGFDDFDDDIPF
ncbi:MULTISPECIES: single-stranded DNA-binding protein [Reinekea]|jgi:single-strand DNA-binding protein|uniref:Single-stranded DNA-binding protein n=1 Tax=Reinekea forsetii TaxID=1336806 RepID=A0A2K8KS57_9GAMM|nr:MULTISPECIES: single-stranded DNA-binding protein [Reinekea]ATX77558.1 single-stranded DNA-binding protein [Reinekea forsetii]